MSSSIKFALAGLGIALILAVALVFTGSGPSADSSGNTSRQSRASGYAIGTLTRNPSCTASATCATHILTRHTGEKNQLWTNEFNKTGLLNTFADYTMSHPSCVVRIDGSSLITRKLTGPFPQNSDDISVVESQLDAASCSTPVNNQ